MIDPNWRGPGVYRLYDQAGRLLYIGKATAGPGSRVRAHQRRPWGRTIARVTWTPCLSEQFALDVEARAIRTEGPRYNRQHNRGRHLPDHLLAPLGRLNPVSVPAWAPRAAALATAAAAVGVVVWRW